MLSFLCKYSSMLCWEATGPLMHMQHVDSASRVVLRKDITPSLHIASRGTCTSPDCICIASNTVQLNVNSTRCTAASDGRKLSQCFLPNPSDDAKWAILSTAVNTMPTVVYSDSHNYYAALLRNGCALDAHAQI